MVIAEFVMRMNPYCVLRQNYVLFVAYVLAVVALTLDGPSFLLVSSFSPSIMITVVPPSSHYEYKYFRSRTTTSTSFVGIKNDIQSSLLSASSSPLSESEPYSKKRSVLVISPPGGIGEVTAVKVAQQGHDVRWLVIKSSSSSNGNIDTATPSSSRRNIQQQDTQQAVVTLSQDILSEIANVGGTLQFAGTDTTSVLDGSSLSAITTWSSSTDTLICTIDGVEQGTSVVPISQQLASKKRQTPQEDVALLEWKKAIYVATREISDAVGAMNVKIAILSATEDNTDLDNETTNSNNNILDPITNLFTGGGGGGGSQQNVPTSLIDAMTVPSRSQNRNANIVKLRHGQLFGIPESSVEFTPFVNGPRRVPELCEEYNMRTIRIDPTITISGNTMLSSTTTRTSRHAMGDAIATCLEVIHPKSNDSDMPSMGKTTSTLDICISSQQGMAIVTPNEWQQEFQRVMTLLSSGNDMIAASSSMGVTGGVELFNVEFGSVPDLDRFADWMTTKWAPAILRTYDIAAIRTGARPVYANRIPIPRNNDETDTNRNLAKTEIIWQQLINFQSVIVGRMTIVISPTSMMAVRGPGEDGIVSRTPLAGEDILVRQLAEAASQAIEKGLATKVCSFYIYIWT
jgi:hypothetical protein